MEQLHVDNLLKARRELLSAITMVAATYIDQPEKEHRYRMDRLWEVYWELGELLPKEAGASK